MRFRYQSIDKKYIQVHVKFEGRLSIQFGRNKTYKKSEPMHRAKHRPTGLNSGSQAHTQAY
jgi:hypothetical protein